MAKKSAKEALKARKKARRRLRNARESGAGVTRDKNTGKPSTSAKGAAKARKKRVKSARKNLRSANRDVRRADYEGATDKQRAKIDRARENFLDDKVVEARQILQSSPNPEARKKAQSVVDRWEATQRRQKQNPAEGGEGWNWRWDRDPNTTKEYPGGIDSDQPPEPPPADDNLQRREIEKWVRRLGLPIDMTDWLIGKVNNEEIPEDGELEDYLPILAEHPSFQKRFPVIVEQLNRWQAGDDSQQVWTPQAVIQYEQILRDTADDYGMSSWVSSPEQVSNLILNDVSIDEARDRINLAAYSSMTAAPQVKDALMNRFGLSEGNLVGFFLDPVKEEQEIRNAVAYSSIVGAAVSRNLGLSWAEAVRLREEGLFDLPQSASEASSVYGQIATQFEQAARTRALSSGYGSTVNDYTRAAAALGGAEAANAVQRAGTARIARFNRRSGVLDTQTGAAGLRTAATR